MIFGNFSQTLLEIFTFPNSYEFHPQNFYILRKNFINNYYYYIYIKFIQQFWQIKIAGMFIHMNVGKYGFVVLNCIITFWCISRKELECSNRTPNSRIVYVHLKLCPEKHAHSLNTAAMRQICSRKQLQTLQKCSTNHSF